METQRKNHKISTIKYPKPHWKYPENTQKHTYTHTHTQTVSKTQKINPKTPSVHTIKNSPKTQQQTTEKPSESHCKFTTEIVCGGWRWRVVVVEIVGGVLGSWVVGCGLWVCGLRIVEIGEFCGVGCCWGAGSAVVVVDLTCVKIVARNCGLLAVDVNDGG